MEAKRITYLQVKHKQKMDLQSKTSVYMIYRWFSSPFTFIFVRLGIPANLVTIANFFPPIFGFYFFSLGTYWFLFIGALFFALFKILDCADGEVARIQNPKISKGQSNIEGLYFDGLGHYIYPICLYSGLGIGLSKLHSSQLYLYLGTALSIFFVLEMALVDLLKSGYRKAALGKRLGLEHDKKILNSIMEEVNQGRSWSDYNIVIKLFGVYPFPGLVYTTEFMPLILMLVIIAEYILYGIYGINMLISVYAVLLLITSFLSAVKFISRLQKRKPITRVIDQISR